MIWALFNTLTPGHCLWPVTLSVYTLTILWASDGVNYSNRTETGLSGFLQKFNMTFF